MNVVIPVLGLELFGELDVPARATGIVVFVHGTGSSSRSPRNRHVAHRLHDDHGLGTLLFDLLTIDEQRHEEMDAQLRLDVDFLAERLIAVTGWLRGLASVAQLPIAYFGCGTSAASALIAAARRPEVAAVVSRGGRADLAADWLFRVRAPVLFIVGDGDQHVLAVDRAARVLLSGPSDLVVIAHAGHLFEEPGALDDVARIAGTWLVQRLAGRAAALEPGPAIQPGHAEH